MANFLIIISDKLLQSSIQISVKQSELLKYELPKHEAEHLNYQSMNREFIMQKHAWTVFDRYLPSDSFPTMLCLTRNSTFSSFGTSSWCIYLVNSLNTSQ